MTIFKIFSTIISKCKAKTSITKYYQHKGKLQQATKLYHTFVTNTSNMKSFLVRLTLCNIYFAIFSITSTINMHDPPKSL